MRDIVPEHLHKFYFGNIHENVLEYERSKYGHEDALYEGLILSHPHDVQLSLSDYKYLYHVTHKLYIDKIERNGLIPKSASKLSNHPERVYLAFDKYDLNTFISHPKNFERPKKSANEKPPPSVRRLFSVAVVLKIIMDRLPYNFRIYADPNFVGKACYTLNTIPWSAIVIEDEFELPQSKV
jgi:hypothetical protein